jgi:hypothetical protein
MRDGHQRDAFGFGCRIQNGFNVYTHCACAFI